MRPGSTNHNPDLVMGRTKSGTLMIEATQYGLRYEVSPPDTPLMQHWVASIERGDVDGSSFSFSIDEDAWDYSTDPPTRTLLHVRDLYDVGPVVYPAYLDATVAVRSLELRAVQFTSQLQRQRLRAMALTFPFLKG
jgi:HK97 family phage prohead protease